MEVSLMNQTWCDAACFISELAVNASNTISSGVSLIRVILGGLVLWTALIIARFVIKGSNPRGRGRRR